MTFAYEIKKANQTHIHDLINIYYSWGNNPFIKIDEDPYQYFERCMIEGDLPPIEDASKEKYQLYVVTYHHQIIGYFDLYQGYPNKNIFWISIFVIHQDLARQGHGKIVLDLIHQKYMDQEKYDLGLGVKLKNIHALKFWTKNGFTKVLGVYGDHDDAVIALTHKV